MFRLTASRLWGLALVTGAALGGLGIASVATHADAAAADRVACPQTGEPIDPADCDLVDADRADCPGRIECPLTGELVCRDECPVDEVPSCCADE